MATMAAFLCVFSTTAAAAHALAGQPKKGSAVPITFSFSPTAVGDKQAFHVTVQFRLAKSLTPLVVPTSWGSATHLEAQFTGVKALTPGTSLSDGDSPGRKLLHGPPGTLAAIAYNLVPMQTEWFRHPQEHMAVINADYFLFNPENALICPAFESNQLVAATFDWRKLPAGMPLFSSFGNGNRLLQIREPWYRVRDALFAGGNFRLTEKETNGSTIALAVRGTWKFTDADAFSAIERVVREENKFWHSAAMPFFLVTIAPFDDQAGDNDGSGFTNAYMLFLSHEDTFDATRIRLLAHEMFHHWNPMSMGSTAGDESAQWFTEGFTVYYENAIPLRAGLISAADYLESLNRRLRQYQSSPLRNATTAEWQKVPHDSGPGYELSYTRGAAIALWADEKIREDSGGASSLDNVMFDLVRQAQVPDPPELTNDRVIAAFGRYLKPDELTQLRDMAIDGADVPLPARLGKCAELEREKVPVVDPGFDDRASLAAHQIVGVDPAGPAYREGIRDGQPMFRVSVYHEDPTKEILVGVVIDGERQMFHYIGTKEQEFAEYKMTSASSDAGCRAF